MIRKKQKRCVRRLACEQLQTRLCLSAVAFASHEIFVSEADRPASVFAADLDGDGDVDVLSASREDGKIAWYENIDGKGSFGPQNVITTEAPGALWVHASDLDGDGDVDVLAQASRWDNDNREYTDNKLAWYENLDGNGSFGQQQVITADRVRAQSVADFDGDGDIDVLAASYRRDTETGEYVDNDIAWYENADGKGTFSGPRVIITEAGYASSISAADLDGDGDSDVLVASVNDDKIAWYENTDGKETFSGKRVITTETAWFHLASADVDGDGDVDVLAAGLDDTAWYENEDGKGSFGPQNLISVGDLPCWGILPADVDGDGDVDLLKWSTCVFPGTVFWHENTDGKGSFGPENLIPTSASGADAAYAADVDGDGDVDVVTASSGDNRIAWCENTDGKGSFGPQQDVTRVAGAPDSLYAVDLDGDADVDLLSWSYSDANISWHENTDGKANFVRRNVATATQPVESVVAVDVDGDGDEDVLSAWYQDKTITLYENTEGKGTFGPQKVITTEEEPRSAHLADVDADGDADLILVSNHCTRRGCEGTLAWYENTDRKGSVGPRQIIASEKQAFYSVHAADVDGDGDVDVLPGYDWPTPIVWYENADGKGSFLRREASTATLAVHRSLHAVDMDGDGDLDILSACASSLAWYENTDGAGSLGQQRVITTWAGWDASVFPADLDSDGDADVIALRGQTNLITWYENTDAKGSFGEGQVIGRGWSVQAADVDGDGDCDVLTTDRGKIYWHEQLPSQLDAGDANRDSAFDQQDILQVLQAAKYLTGKAATWEQGDWNGDGVFNQLDLTAALATGNYLQGPYAVRAADAVLADCGT